MAIGGFPELALGSTSRRFRTAWCSAYLRTVTAATNLEQVADVRCPEMMGRFAQQVAVRSAGQVLVADLARGPPSNSLAHRPGLEPSRGNLLVFTEPGAV